MGTLDRGLTHSLTVHDSSRVAPRPRARGVAPYLRLDTLTSCSNTYVYNDKKGTAAEGDDADARSVGRAVGRTRGRSDAPREWGHRPVVTQGLEHKGPGTRRARGRGTWERDE